VQHTFISDITFWERAHCNSLQHTATHCNTLQHTATHATHIHQRCHILGKSTLQHRLRNTPQHTTTTTKFEFNSHPPPLQKFLKGGAAKKSEPFQIFWSSELAAPLIGQSKVSDEVILSKNSRKLAL